MKMDKTSRDKLYALWVESFDLWLKLTNHETLTHRRQRIANRVWDRLERRNNLYWESYK